MSVCSRWRRLSGVLVGGCSKRNALKERREKEAEKLRLQQLAEKVSTITTLLQTRLRPRSPSSAPLR